MEVSKGNFFKWLQVFNIVSETGSISGAAKKLEVIQPAVSYLLKNLETALGVELFSRRGSSLILSEAGVLLYERSGLLMEHFHALKLEMAALDKSAYRGDIVMATTHSFAGSHLPLYVDMFRRSNPEVNFSLITGLSSKAIIDTVVKAEADFGITSLDYIPNNIRVDFLFRTRLVLIVPHGWSFTRNEHGYIGDLAELEGMPFLVYAPGGNVKRYIERYIKGKGIHPRSCIYINNNNDIRAFVRAGVGCAIVEDFERDNSGWYDIYRLPYDNAASNYYIIRSRRKYLSPQSLAFIRNMLLKKGVDGRPVEEET